MENKVKKDKHEIIKKKWFIQESSKSISEKYDIDNKQILGQGAFGIVYKIALKDNPSDFRVMKTIAKSSLRFGHDKLQFANEIRSMQLLDHPNVIKLYEIFEDSFYVYLIQELCEGGELFDKIIEAQGFSEQLAKYYFRQMIEAIHYCQEKNISHQDLKPENIMLLNKTENSPIKIIDFGFAGIKGNEKKQGSEMYKSPEIENGKNDPLTDIWACGTILYTMVTVRFPYVQKKVRITDPNTQQQKVVIKNVPKLNFALPVFEKMSEDLKDLLTKIFQSSDKRINSQQILQHPWLQKEEGQQSKIIENLQINSLKAYSKSNQLRKMVLVHIATNLQESDILELQQIFKSLDQDSSGTLSFDELKKGINQLKSSNPENEQQLKQIFDSLDADGTGQINYTEFIAACIQQSDYLQTEKLITIFKEIDKNGDGQLSLEEIRNYMKHKIDNEGTFVSEIAQKSDLQNSDFMLMSKSFGTNMMESMNFYQKIVKQNDKNGDGAIDFEEFKKLMESPDLMNMKDTLTMSMKQNSESSYVDNEEFDKLMSDIQEFEEK